MGRIDRHGNKLPGVTLHRGEPVPEGMYHLVSEVLVRHTDGSFLLMRRDPGKHCGGLWEAAGGSALRGEDAPACAGRELEEETGLSGRLIPLGALRHEAHRTWYAIYLCRTDRRRTASGFSPGRRWTTAGSAGRSCWRFPWRPSPRTGPECSSEPPAGLFFFAAA